MGVLPSDTLGGLITGLNALFCLTAWIMFGGKANIPAFPLGGTLLGVGGSDGDWGTTTTLNTMQDWVKQNAAWLTGIDLYSFTYNLSQLVFPSEGTFCSKDHQLLQSSALFLALKWCKEFKKRSPTIDQDRISPHNINTVSSRQAVKIKKNINKGIISWSNTKISKLTFKNCMADSKDKY